MEIKLLLVDADGLAFHSLRESLVDSLNALDEKILNMFEETKATHYVMFISKGRYFRHNIYPDYKKPRERYRDRQSWIRTLKAVLEEKYNAQWMQEVEADDLVAYYQSKEFIYLQDPDQLMLRSKCENLKMLEEGIKAEVIVCTPDKDLLQSIPGKHFNYTYRLEDKENPNSLIRGWWVETTFQETENFRKMQLVVGDQSDCVPGIEGKGIKFWEKISSEFTSYEEILRHYILKYGISEGIYKYQLNYRVLHLLENDADFIREVGTLPELTLANPVYSKVKTEEEDYNFENAEF